MITNKSERAYRWYVATAIRMARKSANGRVPYDAVIPKQGHTQYSYMQWACAEGWLAAGNGYVCEGKKAKCLTMAEAMAELMNYKQ